MIETENSRVIFSKNLQYLMQEKGVSRKEVCETLDVSYYTFSDWCNGKKYPRIEKIEILAEYFGIPISDLIGRKSESIEEGGIKTTPVASERVSTFADRLRLAMKRKKVKRIDLVKAADIDQGSMTHYLQGKYEPKQDTLVKLANILGISEQWLWGYGADDEMVLENELPKMDVQDMAKKEILDIILRLHSDEDFREVVEKVSKFDDEKLNALVLFLKSFG